MSISPSKALTIFIVVLAMCALGLRSGQAAAIDTLRCTAGVLDTLDLGPHVSGETVQASFSFVNSSGQDTVRISSSDSRLIVMDSLLRGIRDSVVHVQVVLIPDSTGAYFPRLTIQPVGGGCSASTKTIHSFVRSATADSAALGLSHTASTFIVMEPHADSTTVTVRLINNTADTVQIQSLALDSGVHFRVNPVGTALPVQLLPNAYLTAVIAFVHPPLGVTRDSLIVVGSNPIVTDGFVVIGYRRDSLAVRTPDVGNRVLGTNHLFSAIPNPSPGRVRLVGPLLKNGVIDIRDVLGKSTIDPMTVQGDISSWQLDAHASNLSPGAYFLHIEGTTTDGVAVHETVRVVIE